MSPTTESAPGGEALAPPASSSGKPSPEPSPKLRRELLRLLLSVVKDPERAYTAYEEIMSAVGENVVAEVGARVEALGGRIDGLNTRVVALMESTNARMDSLDARIDALAESTNARMDALDARVDALMESTNARMDALDARIEALAESTTARIDALMESTNVRIDALATIVARMDARLERLENHQSRLIWGVLGLQTALVVALVTLVLSV